MPKRTDFQFEEYQARALIEYQGQANDVMSTAWRTSSNKELPYYRAASVELFEAIVEIGYKWWKGSQVFAVRKVVQELVDALHFVVSDHIRRFMSNTTRGEDAALSFLVNSLTSINEPAIERIGAYADHKGALSLEELSLQDIIEQAMYQYLRDGYASIGWLAVLFDRLEIQPAQIYGYYLAKNTLNKFRTANGNGKGAYAQLWDDREDTDFLQDFVESSVEGNTQLDVETIWNFLDETYTTLYTEGRVGIK